MTNRITQQVIRSLIREILAEQDSGGSSSAGSTPGLYKGQGGATDFVFQMSDFSNMTFPTPEFKEEKKEVSGEELIGVAQAVKAADVAAAPAKYGINQAIFTPNGGRPGTCNSCLHPIHNDHREHSGVDISPTGITAGAEALAVASGTVRLVDSNTRVDSTGEVITTPGAGAGGSGNEVHIYITSEQVTVKYFHLEAVTVSQGDAVTPGKPIGRVGATGIGTGPHLHFEVWKGKDRMEPANYLKNPAYNWIFPVALLPGS
jgi:murein DD-endopeptidase MepM/ murein hydrolase activator NlpD